MSDPNEQPTPAEQQAAEFAASLDAAADDLEGEVEDTCKTRSQAHPSRLWDAVREVHCFSK